MMKLSTSVCLAIGALCVLSQVTFTLAHSWVACTDYRGDQSTYNPSQCFGYPRNWQNVASGSAFGEDRGYNYQAPKTGAQPCRDRLGAAPGYGYTASYPMAQYKPGSQVCLAWPSKNHVAATCTNPYIPDTRLELYHGGMTGSSDPAQSTFRANLVRNWTEHQNGVIDFKGFQRCPRFCNNMDKSLCTQCFTVPSNLQVGKVYTFQWYWIFNQGTDPYTSCWEAMIVSGTGGSGSGTGTGGSSTTGSSIPPSTTTGRGTVVPPPPICQQDIGVIDLPTSGDVVFISKAPFIVSAAGAFDVVVAYSATGTRVINVDLLDTSTNMTTVYAHGSAAVDSGKGTVSVSVALTGDKPALGTHYRLRTWIVDETYANQNDAFLYELARDQADVSVAEDSVYSEDMSPCEDQAQCGDLCGAGNVSQCDCDINNKVTVVCAGTPMPASSTRSAASTLSTSSTIFVAVVAMVAVAAFL